MPKTDSHLIVRLLAGAAVATAFALTPQLALAQAPGSLTELASSPTTGDGLNGTQDVVVSPDGKNVYAIASGDDAITEFARSADGSLMPLPTATECIADASDSSSSCPNQTGQGLVEPEAIAISPDGNSVYVAAEDSNFNGAIAEFARNADGSLTELSGHDCIAENVEGLCDDQGAHGIQFPVALAVSPDGKDVYAGDEDGQDIATFARGSDGSLTQPASPDDCIQDAGADSSECASTATGLSNVTGVFVSPDGDNVYTAGWSGGNSNATIAEFSRNADGTLSQLSSPNDCLGTPEAGNCGAPVAGVVGITGLTVSPDGRNVYTASEGIAGPIAEFSRGTGGALTQLASPNNCIQEQGGTDFGCGTTGTGIGSGYELAVSPDGASVYAAAPGNTCSTNTCSDVAEFARNVDGSLTQLASPDSCIQDVTAEGSECPGNETGNGLGGPGVAISPDGSSVYVSGTDDIAAFARTPVTHALTVSISGSGSGSVTDGTSGISCPSACSNTYTANSVVTLTATPRSGSTFTGWSGACSGTGTCAVTMSSDMAVTATFTTSAPPTPGSPAPVLTSAPTAVTDAGAGFLGSVNPEGLPTTVYFQYGLDKRYSQVGASGPNYTRQTASQQVSADFSTHGIGPVTVAGLVPNALYHVRLVATNSAGTAVGQDVTFKTALAPLPGTPTLGQTFNIAPVSGLVLIYIHGQLVPLTQLEQIGPNVPIDALHGTLKLTINPGGSAPARDRAHASGVKTQTGEFGGAVFKLHQAKSGRNKGLTTLMMVESAFKGAPSQSICNAPKSASDAHAAKINSKVIQLLHSSGHGKFATSGRYGAATVRGTVWDTIARCDGTLIKDIKDEVVVTDFVRHKTILLHAGQSYLAPGPRQKKPR